MGLNAAAKEQACSAANAMQRDFFCNVDTVRLPRPYAMLSNCQVLVAGRGYQQGDNYAFPVLRPISVIYPNEVSGRNGAAVPSELPDLHEVLSKADKTNILQVLRKLAV